MSFVAGRVRLRASYPRQLQRTFSFLLRVVPVLHRDVILQGLLFSKQGGPRDGTFVISWHPKRMFLHRKCG